MRNIGFGLERIGLAVVNRPILGILLVVALTALAIAGTFKLKVNSEFTELFRKDSEDYVNYEALLQKFPGGGGDVFVVIESANLLSRENLEKIRSLHLDLELVDGVAGVLSMFSLREAPDKTGFAAPLFPDPLPEGAGYGPLIDKISSHRLVAGKLLAKKKDLALIVVALERKILNQRFRGVVRDLRNLARDTAGASDLKTTLTGIPVMRREIHKAIKHDRIVYNVGGFVIGCLVCFIFFRSWPSVLIAAAAPFAAVLWSFGMFGLIGQKLNVIIVIIAPLVMVVSFSDSMHLVFGIRHGLDDGLTRKEAIKRAIRSIGPACVLTSLTTAIALSSLALSGSSSIREFGLYGALAALIAFLAVIVVVPLLCLLLLPAGKRTVDANLVHSNLIRKLYDFSSWLAGTIPPRASRIALVGTVLMMAATAAQFQLEPSYRLGDYVPDGKMAARGLARLDQSFGGSQPIHIMVAWPARMSLSDRKVASAIAATHNLLEQAATVSNVFSLHSLNSQDAPDAPADKPGELTKYLDQLPEHLTKRLISADREVALVSGRIRDLPSPEARVALAELEPPLTRLRAEFPDFKFTLAGLSALSARQSDPLIAGLRNSLFVAILLVIALIGISFRSARLAFLSILPNVLPIVASGAVLYLAGVGLQIASTVAMTVAFGLAVDDTVHFLHRYHWERGRTSDTADAIAETVRRIGPVLVLTTIVLILGLSVTLLSAVPANRLFGQLCAVILTVALAADLLILPALLFIFRKSARKPEKAGADASS